MHKTRSETRTITSALCPPPPVLPHPIFFAAHGDFFVSLPVSRQKDFRQQPPPPPPCPLNQPTNPPLCSVTLMHQCHVDHTTFICLLPKTPPPPHPTHFNPPPPPSSLRIPPSPPPPLHNCKTPHWVPTPQHSIHLPLSHRSSHPIPSHPIPQSPNRPDPPRNETYVRTPYKPLSYTPKPPPPTLVPTYSHTPPPPTRSPHLPLVFPFSLMNLPFPLYPPPPLHSRPEIPPW